MKRARVGSVSRLVAVALLLPILLVREEAGRGVAADAAPGQSIGTPPPADRRGSPFLLGANYPYHAYGNDFGANGWGSYGVHDPSTAAAIDADFARMAGAGITVVRWFVFADGRAGIVFDDMGLPIGLDDAVFPDLDAALEIAARHGIVLDLVLLDFLFMGDATFEDGVQKGGHARVITSPAGQQAFVEVVLLPLLHRYGDSHTIHSWEVMNEPEWALSDAAPDKQISTPATFATFRAFVRQVADAVHRYSGSSVTVGSASTRWVRQWTGVGLDYYQVHYYDWMGNSGPNDLYRMQAADLGLDRPVVVGEFPATRSRTSDLTGYLDRWYGSGYAGAWFWSFASVDQWGSADLAVLAAWSRAHAPPSNATPPNDPCASP